MSRDIFIVLVGLFLAGLLRGFTGFGLALAAVPMLALVLPPQQVIPVIATVQLMAGVFDLPAVRRQADWRLVTMLAWPMALATPVGFLALAWFSPDVMRLVIGLLVVASVLALWRKITLPAWRGRGLPIGVGLVSGLMNGVAAMPGPVVVVYFLALDVASSTARASFIAFFVLTAAAVLVPLALGGLANPETTIWAATGLLPLLAGQYLGGLGFRRTSPATHRLVSLACLTGLAVVLMVKAITALL